MDFSSSAYGTNTSLSFDGGENYFANRDIPEFTIIPKMDIGKTEALNEGSSETFFGSGDAGGQAIQAGGHGGTFSVEDLPPEERAKYLSDDTLFQYEHGSSRLIFDQPAHLRYYSSLATNKEKREFLLELVSQSVAKKLQDPDLAKALILLKKPDAIAGFSSNTTQQATKALRDLFDLISQRTMAISNIFSSEHDSPETKRFKETRTASLIAMNPVLGAYKTSIIGFGDRVKSHPIDYLLFLDTLPTDKRAAFFTFMDAVNGQHMAFETSYLDLDKPFKIALQNPKLIGAYGTTTQFHFNPEDFITITLVDDGGHPIPARIGSGQSDKKVDGKKTASLPEAKRDRTHASEVIPKNFISADFMLELIQKFNPTRKYPVAILTQWTPTFSRAFQQLNKDGKYDEFFSELYPIVSRYRQKKNPRSQLVPNPLYKAGNVDPHQESFEKMIGAVGSSDDDLLMGHEMLGGRYTPKEVPQDLVPILQNIEKRL